MFDTPELITFALTALLLVLAAADFHIRRRSRPRPPKPLQVDRQGTPSAARRPDAERISVGVSAAEREVAARIPGQTAPRPSRPGGTQPVGPGETVKLSLAERLRAGLGKTRASFGGGLAELFGGRRQIDQEVLEDLETLLLGSDVGVEATDRILKTVTDKVSRKELGDAAALRTVLQEELREILRPCQQALRIAAQKPFVILVVGVNGAGKTTTIGKLAWKLKQEGKTVLLAAGDTFRAAAVEQLQVWGERNQVPVVAQPTGSDSASVIYDAIESAQARGIDVVIADTAGRLQNKDNLMNELGKVVRVIRKRDAAAPHEVLLVLDGGTGQNAIVQAEQFRECVGVTGIAVTKLDGTARGGVVFAIAERHALPIRFVGVGEGMEDLRPFDADEYVAALFGAEARSLAG